MAWLRSHGDGHPRRRQPCHLAHTASTLPACGRSSVRSIGNAPNHRGVCGERIARSSGVRPLPQIAKTPPIRFVGWDSTVRRRSHPWLRRPSRHSRIGARATLTLRARAPAEKPLVGRIRFRRLYCHPLDGFDRGAVDGRVLPAHGSEPSSRLALFACPSAASIAVSVTGSKIATDSENEPRGFPPSPPAASEPCSAWLPAGDRESSEPLGLTATSG